jgi:hypothetical protein
MYLTHTITSAMPLKKWSKKRIGPLRKRKVATEEVKVYKEVMLC